MNALLSTLAAAYRTILRNPQYRGWVILGSLLYLISPIDLSPDLIPILGQIDDVALMALLFSELSKLLGEAVRDRAQIGSWFTGFRREVMDTTNPEAQQSASASTSTSDVDYTQTVDVQATPVDRSS